MTMSTKDYRIIAGAIREVVENDEHPNPKTIAESIAYALKTNSGLDANGNRRFDVGRFMVETGTLAREWTT